MKASFQFWTIKAFAWEDPTPLEGGTYSRLKSNPNPNPIKQK